MIRPMAETVLITTQDLEPAVRLRDAFQEEGLDIELVTPGERIRDVAEPKLLVLTGALDDKQARRLVREAADHDHLPVIGLFDSAAQLTPDSRANIGQFVDVLRGLNEWTVAAIDGAARSFAEARGLKLGKVAQPLRAALTGRTVSPGIFEVMVLIGREESLARLSDQSSGS